MRATLFSTLLITALAACPMYARTGDGNRRPPGGGGGQRTQRGEQRDGDREDKGRKDQQEDVDVDLSPWIQAWAREGIKGKALTQWLEKLMDQKRAGKLPPAPGKEAEKQANAQRPQGGGDGFGPRFGRFGGPQGPGPGMRGGGGGPGMPGGRGGMMRGPGMRGGGGDGGGNDQRMQRGPGMPGGPGMQRGPGMDG